MMRVLPQRTKQRAVRARGLTLIELMVALAVMAVMVLGFGMILSSAQSVVSGSQAEMRSNQQAAAVARTLRQDFARITKQGFLYIGTDGNGAPIVVFSDAAYFDSEFSEASGHAAIITYGQAPNVTSASEPILFRRTMILQQHTPTYRDFDIRGWPEDVVKDGSARQGRDLSWYTALEKDTLRSNIVSNFAWVPSGLGVPTPNSLTAHEKLWQVVAVNVHDLQIAWATSEDGQGDLNWQTSGGFWTHHDQNNWPVAVKIRFRIRDKNMPAEFRENNEYYEVLCPVGR